jgi:hypothetical protein
MWSRDPVFGNMLATNETSLDAAECDRMEHKNRLKSMVSCLSTDQTDQFETGRNRQKTDMDACGRAVNEVIFDEDKP